MTPNKKLFYLLGLCIVFIITIPVLILFSSGYRLDSKYRLVKTGGINLVNNESGIIVKLDGKNIKKAGVFEKNILIRNLTPQTYHATVEKEGFKTWKKNIKVEEQKVEVCYPLLVPNKLNLRQIPKYLPKKEEKKGKKPDANEEYSEAMKLFGTDDKIGKKAPAGNDSDKENSEFGADRKLNKKVLLFRQENKIYVKWTGMEQKRPFFIDSPDKKLVYAPDKKIHSFDFFPGRNNAVLVLLENLNLYAMEIDRRFEIQNIYKIATNCKSFAVKDEFLYYLSGKSMNVIDFEP